ncbi:uncharacterized protein [Chironomus tepperi]|uniref:uncharacterized protein n=1 Tax=Chironomus tepperi TaxID=113505 RepID=UPI00391F1AC5
MQSLLATKRLSIAVMVVLLISIKIMESSGNPNPDHSGDPVNVVDALRYLQDIESKHAQFARPRHYEHNDGVSITFVLEMLEQLDRKHARTPRFGKRGNNDYLTKEYTNNVLRFILENPEYFQHLQQQES